MPNGKSTNDNQSQKTLYEPECRGHVVIDAPVTWKEGDVIAGLYVVRGILGEGKFGTVYKVYHQSWKIDLAVKSPKEDVLDDKGAVRRFLKEAQTWVELGMHPNIVTCFYVRELSNIPRIFLEYAEGGNLRDKLNKGVSLEEAIDLAIQICRGMDYAQKHNLVHRDLKPENCVMDKYGNLKVTDFGLVKIDEAEDANEQKSIGKTGRAGTPEYMAPEQWVNAAEANTKADIWALGAMLYEMCSGSKPFEAEEDEPSYVFYARLISSKWAVKKIKQNLPQDLRLLIKECLNAEPSTRPDSFNNLEDRLTGIYEQVIGKPYPRHKAEEVDIPSNSLNNRAVSLLDLGRTLEAEYLFDDVLHKEPSHLLSTYNRGLLLWRQGRISDMDLMGQLETIRKVENKEQLAEYLMGLIHLESGDKESAVKELEQVLRQSIDDNDAFNQYDITHRLAEARVGLIKQQACSRIFAGNTPWVFSVRISPDGRTAISGGGDKILLWDLSTGHCLKQMGYDSVTGVYVSPDGGFALSCGSHNTFRLWELSTGSCLNTFEGHTGSVLSVCISSDGKFGLSGSSDRTLRLWEMSTGSCLNAFEGHTGSVLSVCISSDGKFGLSGGGDNTLRLWEMSTGICLGTFEGHTGWVQSVCISPDGKLGLSGSRDNTLRLWELATGRCLRTLAGHSDIVNSVCISPDGKLGLSGSDDRTVRLWDLTPGTPSPFILAFPQSSTLFYQRQEEFLGYVREAERSYDAGMYAKAVNFFIGARSFTGYECDKSEAFLNLQYKLGNKGIRKSLRSVWPRRTFKGHSYHVNSVSISPDGKYGLSASNDKTLRLWDLSTGCNLKILVGHTDIVNSVSISPDCRFILSGSNDKTMRLWDWATGHCLKIFDGHTSSVKSVCISPDGKFGLSGSSDKNLWLWDLSTTQWRRNLVWDSRINSICISPDGRFELAPNPLELRELSTGRCLRTFRGPEEHVGSVSISPDGRFALTGSDNTLRLWEISTGRCLRTFDERIRNISICMFPDGRFALTGSDNALRLWEISTGRCLRTFEGVTDSGEAVCISPDGRYVIVGSRDNTLQLWELNWEYEFPDESDWDEGARPYLEIFLTVHSPYANDGITHEGKPLWTGEDFQVLVRDLGYRGYGWLREEGVRNKLNELANERR